MKKIEFSKDLIALAIAIIGLLTAITGLIKSQYTQENLYRTNEQIGSFKKTTNAEISKTNEQMTNLQEKTNIDIKMIKEEQNNILDFIRNPPSPPEMREEKETMSINKKISFNAPASFVCGANLKWIDLEDWKPVQESRICSDSDVYPVKGQIVANKGTALSAEIYLPEIDKWFPASGGGIITPNSEGIFSANFCLESKGPHRSFKFKLLQNGRLVGNECRINVKGM